MLKKPDSTLRPYQIEALQTISSVFNKGGKAVMLQMPTGAGKTRLFVNLIALQPARYLIVTHREELVEQISETLTNHYHLEHGILQGKNIRDLCRDIIVASIQSWTKNKRLLHDFDCIVVDEAHHSLADSYVKLWECYPNAKKLGVTATPYRLKKAAFTELYDKLIESWPMRRMIEEGYLSSYRLFSVSEKKASIRKINRLTKFGVDGDYKVKDLQDIMSVDEEIDFLYECYRQNAVGKKGIIYAINREHAKKIAERFVKEGITAVAIDSKTKAKERKQSIEDFKQGKIQILVNVELFTEGFDCPSIEFVMLARPTRSLTMYMQQVGRALRPTPNGERVFILDCAGLRHRFGLPDRKRDWQNHFKGERSQTEQYEKNTLGEQECFSLLREYKRDVSQFKLKPEIEILPSDNDIHIFARNDYDLYKNYKLYGTCDKDGNIIERASYTEIHRTPFGWFQGILNIDGNRFHVVFNKKGRVCLICSSLHLVEYNVYEAVTGDCSIRFGLNLKIIPKDVFFVNRIRIYQISYNNNKLYSSCLILGSYTLPQQMSWGNDYVLLFNTKRHLDGLLYRNDGEVFYTERDNGIITVNGENYIKLQDGRMIGENGDII